MYRKFCIGFFIAAFVCSIMLICDSVAEASMLGSIPDIQCATPVLVVKPFMHFIVLLVTVASIFL